MAELVVGRTASRRICVGEQCRVVAPLMGATLPELEAQLDAVADQPADMIEWRVDALATMADLDHALEVVTTQSSLPVIATVRTKKQGGLADVSAETYCTCVTQLARLADIVDVEIETPHAGKLIDTVHHHGAQALGSMHFVRATPGATQLMNTFAREMALGADILKVAARVRTTRDTAALLAAAARIRHWAPPIVAIGMGKLGATTRLMGMTVGNALTFATLDHASAPGQFSLAQTRHALDLVGG